MEDEKKTPTFEEVAETILKHVNDDRASLLEVVDAMKKVAEDSPETALVFCEQIVKAHDVLNKQTSQAASLAALLLKEKIKKEDGDEREDIWSDMGDAFPSKEN